MLSAHQRPRCFLMSWISFVYDLTIRLSCQSQPLEVLQLWVMKHCEWEKWIRLLRQETRDSQNNSSHFANSWCFQVIFNLSVGICTSLAYCSLSAHLCFLTVLAHQQERMSSEIVLCSSSQEWQLFLLAWCRSVCEREWERQRVTHWLCSSEVILDLLLMPKGVPACFTALFVSACVCVCVRMMHIYVCMLNTRSEALCM